MLDVAYRPAREEDISAALDLFFIALQDTYTRYNINTPLPPRGAVEIFYRHIWRTGIFYVAEIDGKLASICHAIVRDHLWFLSGFWTLPQWQRQKIGGALLRHVRQEGVGEGASTFFVWSSIDQTAMASYFKMGMLPGYQILTFEGTVGELPKAPEGYATSQLTVSAAGAMDRAVRATSREVDHRFWLEELKSVGRRVSRDGSVIGYYYFNGESVGPLAWLTPEGADATLTLACREAARTSDTLRLRVPGINHDAIRFALKIGLRFDSFAHLLTSAPFGRLDQYVASTPSLF